MPECTLDNSRPIQLAVRFATVGSDSQRVILPLDRLQTSRSPACNRRTASSNPCPISSTFLPPAAHEHVLPASLDAHRQVRPQVKEESKVSPEAGRSDVVASPQPVCAVCGGPRDPRKREACSDKCRTELSRRRRKGALRRRDGEIRALLATALRKLEEGAP